MYHEPDTEQHEDPRQIEAELFGHTGPLDNPESAAPLRFGIAELLTATTVAAVLLALFRATGIVGAAFSFVVAFAFTLGLYPKWQPSVQRQALMFDFVWGMVMPVVCLVFDPFIFKQEESLGHGAGVLETNLLTAQVYDYSFVAYIWLGWQIAALGLVLTMGRIRGAWPAIISGTLVLGAGFAALLGVLLVPFATFGLFMMIGVLGYTPLFTAYTYWRRCKQVSKQATMDLPDSRCFAWGALGTVAAFVVPLIFGLALLTAIRGGDALFHLVR